MGKRADLKRQQIFERALIEAAVIAAADGLTGLTARRIAKRIGCSVGTIYNVFENLDVLILHLNGRTLDALFDALGGIAPGGKPLADVEAVVRCYLEFTQANINLWGVIFEHVWPKDYALPDWYMLKVQRVLGVLEGAMAPLFPAEATIERHRAAAVLWSGLHGLCSLSMSGKLGTVDQGDLEEMVELLIDNFIAGLERGA